MKTPKVKYYPREDGRWGWTLVAGNGEILCPSQGYASRGGAVSGFKAVQRNIVRAVTVFVDKAPSAK